MKWEEKIRVVESYLHAKDGTVIASITREKSILPKVGYDNYTVFVVGVETETNIQNYESAKKWAEEQLRARCKELAEIIEDGEEKQNG